MPEVTLWGRAEGASSITYSSEAAIMGFSVCAEEGKPFALVRHTVAVLSTALAGGGVSGRTVADMGCFRKTRSLD